MHTNFIVATLVGLASTTSLSAQRERAEFEFQKRNTVIEYGAVPVGKHSLDELAVGTTWRLGNNIATTWLCEMPIFAGDVLLVPGHYRIGLVRDSEDRASIAFAGSGLATGSGSELRAQGQFEDVKKPGKRLTIELSPAGKGSKTSDRRPLHLRVEFGPKAWVADLDVVAGTRSTKLGGGWTLDVFALPADLVNARGQRPVAVATLQKKNLPDDAPVGWNLVLGGDEARLVPWMKAPTEQFGFGEPTAPDPEWSTTGTIEGSGDAQQKADDGATTEAEEPLALESASSKKGVFTIGLSLGDRKFTVTVPAPTPPKK